MSAIQDGVLLWVPRKVAKKLDEKAKKKGITGRAPWTILSRMILNEAAEAEA